MKVRLFKWLSEAIIVVNWFDGAVQADITVADRLYKWIQMYQTMKLLHVSYLSLSWIDWIDIEKNIFGRTGVLTLILLERFQNMFEFETEHRKTCFFPSQRESSIPTFRDMDLHLLV